jgi:hypothetical protein
MKVDMSKWTPETMAIIAAVYSGLLAVTSIIGTIVYDLIAIHNDWKTVSQETIQLASAYPVVWVIIVATLCLALGILIGHIFC